MNDLSNEDLSFILESLEFTKHKFENYDKYPSVDYKQKRINEVTEIISKIKIIIKERRDL